MTSLIDRVLDLLDMLANHPDGLSLSEIAKSLGIPKSAAHRLLAVVVNRNFAAQDEQTQRYRLSIRAASLGFRFFGNAGMVEICQPLLDRLAARTGELVRLSVRESATLTFVAQATRPNQGLRYEPELGLQIALHATANGRAFLSTLSDEEAVTLVRNHGYILPPDHARSFVNNELELLRALRETREVGYSLSVAESNLDISAVAVPILGRNSPEAVGTVSVAGPNSRMSAARILQMVPDLQATATELSAVWPLGNHSLKKGKKLSRNSVSELVVSVK